MTDMAKRKQPQYSYEATTDITIRVHPRPHQTGIMIEQDHGQGLRDVVILDIYLLPGLMHMLEKVLDDWE